MARLFLRNRRDDQIAQLGESAVYFHRGVAVQHVERSEHGGRLPRTRAAHSDAILREAARRSRPESAMDSVDVARWNGR